MSAIFSIIPRIRTPCVNGGENLEIEVFFTGEGKTDNPYYKLKVSYSSPYVFEKDNDGKVGLIEGCISSGTDSKGRVVSLATGNNQTVTFPLHEVGATLTLPAGYFLSFLEFEDNLKAMGKLDVLQQFKNSVELNNYKYPINDRFGEMSWDGQPPLLIKLKTRIDAPSGNHNLFLTLFYKSGSEFRMDEKIVEFHINTWIERHERKLQWTAVILGLIALGAELINIGFSILSSSLH
jgi:hypothetical protein